MRDLRRVRRPTILALGCALLAGCVGVAGPAPEAARPARTGVSHTAGIAPPPGAPYGGTCYAEIYACRLPASLPLGTACTCPASGAPSHGVVR